MAGVVVCALGIILALHVTTAKVFLLRSAKHSERHHHTELEGASRVRRRFVPAAVPRDLTVGAVVLNFPRRLGLSVTWERGSGPRAAESFTLLVHPANETEEAKEYCGIYSYHHDIDAGRNTWLISKESHSESTHLKVEPECSYSFQLWANPYDGKSRAKLLYTVPRCVGEVCSCREAEATLPHAHVASPVPLTEGRYNISWSAGAPPNGGVDLRDAHFILSVGPEVFKPYDGRPTLYNLASVARVPWKGPWSRYSATFETNSSKTHLALVTLEDRWGCFGLSANQTFTISERPTALNKSKEVSVKPTSPSATPNNHLLVGVVVPCVALALVALGGIIFAAGQRQRCTCSPCLWLRRKTRLGTLQPVKSWRSVYHAVNTVRENGRYTANPSAEERNVLYVEQEIQEALERGDADCYEVNYNRLHLGKQIGRGAFGRVFLARIDSVGGNAIHHTIAVKKLKQRASPDELDDFLAEIATLKQVGKHSNVVALVGCCTIVQPYCMLMEWVPCGDLLRYLRRLRAQVRRRNMALPQPYIDILPIRGQASDSSYVVPEAHSSSLAPAPEIEDHHKVTQQSNEPGAPGSSGGSCCGSAGPSSCKERSSPLPPSSQSDLDPRELHSFALQIARGMAHLELKQITHRDLAARNVLIDENRCLKISDFGLSRSGIYVNTKRRKVPLRWLSVEAMRDNLYSSRSDVWAYGVVLWEIGTLGGFPYPTIADIDLLAYVLQGKRLEQPHNCTNELYELMTQCWQHEADERPTFANICTILEASLDRKHVYVDFATLTADITLPPTEQVTNEQI